MVMTFQTHQFRREQRQAKRTGADKRQVRMRQTATIARQTMRQPVIRSVKEKGQALRMRYFDPCDANKQFA